MLCSDPVFKVEVLSKTIQKSAEDIAQDINRPRYFDAWEAKDYGIIDQVCQSFCFWLFSTDSSKGSQWIDVVIIA